MTAVTDRCTTIPPAGAVPGTSAPHSVTQRLDAAWALCRMLAAAGASLCLAAPAAALAWQALFLAGVAIAAASSRRAAALAGIASAMLLIAAPFIGAMPWETAAPAALEGAWPASGSSDDTALRTIAVLAIILLAGSPSLRVAPGTARR